MDSNLAPILRLLLIADERLFGGRDPVALCRAAVRGGVTAVQLRWKGGPAREQVALARRLRDALTVPLFVNDRPDVAVAAGAAGAHLGADDLPVALARRIVPPGFLIGASVGDDAEVASALGCDYAGVGPWRHTATKPDAGSALGPEGAGRLIARMAPIPAVVIGGVAPRDVPEAWRRGAAGVAAGSGILGAEDVERAAAAYREAERGFA
jgi:thiamine-phosphate diphosphorylase